MPKETNKSVGERTAQKYVDTTLRTSHYKQQQRVEDSSVDNGNKIKNLKIITIIMSIVLCLTVLFKTNEFVLDDSNYHVERYWKYFWKAAAFSQQKDYEQMDYNLNKMLNLPCCNSDRLNRALNKAEVFCPKLEEAVTAIIILFENKDLKQAFGHMVKIKKSNPEQWDSFIKKQIKERNEYTKKKLTKNALH